MALEYTAGKKAFLAHDAEIRAALAHFQNASAMLQELILEDIAAYDSRGLGLNLTGGAYPEQIRGIRVTADYFRLFGAPVALGRTFTIL